PCGRYTRARLATASGFGTKSPDGRAERREALLRAHAGAVDETHHRLLHVLSRDQGRAVRRVPGDHRDPGLQPAGGVTGAGAGARPPPAAFSVVIPVLNEAGRIARRLTELRDLRGVAEVIVVDGGSTDRTPDLVRSFPHARLITAERGRGLQMNAGARVATGDVLLFLHADTSLPDDAAHWIAWALAHP